MQKESLFDKT